MFKIHNYTMQIQKYNHHTLMIYCLSWDETDRHETKSQVVLFNEFSLTGAIEKVLWNLCTIGPNNYVDNYRFFILQK